MTTPPKAPITSGEALKIARDVLLAISVRTGDPLIERWADEALAALVGLADAVPQDDATLDGARGAVLGQIARVLRARADVPGGEMPPLPDTEVLAGDVCMGDAVCGFTADQMRDYVLADRAQRASAVAAPVSEAQPVAWLLWQIDGRGEHMPKPRVALSRDEVESLQDDHTSEIQPVFGAPTHPAPQEVEQARDTGAVSMPGDWTVEWDSYTAPGTIRLNSPKWGGCFLGAPKPGDIVLSAIIYRLLADMLCQSDLAAMAAQSDDGSQG